MQDQPFGFSEFQKTSFLAFARSIGKLASYAENETIFTEKDPPTYMYVVLSGQVRLTRHDREVETIHEGSTLGVLSLLDQQTRTTTATAAGTCELALFDRKKFRYMVEEMPRFSLFIMAELAHRLRATNAML